LAESIPGADQHRLVQPAKTVIATERTDCRLPAETKCGTSKCMKTEEVASKLAALCREQKWLEAINSLYGEDIVSVEAQEIGEMPAEMRGLDQVRGKTQWFLETNQVHGCTIGGPFVARDKFVVQFDVDVTDKESGKRAKMSELGIYTVKDGKIVREEFLPHAQSEG
jgi:SnoaL-like domain